MHFLEETGIRSFNLTVSETKFSICTACSWYHLAELLQWPLYVCHFLISLFRFFYFVACLIKVLKGKLHCSNKTAYLHNYRTFAWKKKIIRQFIFATILVISLVLLVSLTCTFFPFFSSYQLPSQEETAWKRPGLIQEVQAAEMEKKRYC